MSTNEDTAAKVKAVIEEFLGVADATPEKHLVDDLGADSLDQVEITMAMEDEFSIVISDEDAVACKTVQNYIDLVTKLTSK